MSGPTGHRVAYVTQWFPPEPMPTPLCIAQALRRQGLDISVLTGIPNYPTGRVSEGYAAWRPMREMYDGFRVLRAPLFPYHSRSALGRFANYASYAVSSATMGGPLLRSTDVALVYSSPATAASAALLGRVRWRTPFVLLLLDLWPDSVFASGFLTAGLKRRAAEIPLTWFSTQTYRRASHIAVTTPGMEDILVARGVPVDKVSIVYNWADEELMRPVSADPEIRSRLGMTDEFLLMYAGNHGRAQRLDVAVHAMARLHDRPDVHLVLIGDGIEKPALRSLARRLRLPTVHFMDPVTPERMAAVTAAADLQLVCLADQALFHITLPSKVQSILACGLPVLACAPGDAARVVTAAGAGLACAPGDPVRLAETLRQAVDMPRDSLREMGRAGHDYYHSRLSERINAGRLAELLRSAASQGVAR